MEIKSSCISRENLKLLVMKLLTIITACFLGFALSAQNSFGELTGYVFEKSTTEIPAMYTKVWVESVGAKYGDVADENGKYRISGIPAGKYLIKALYDGDTLNQLIEVNIIANGIVKAPRIDVKENVQELIGVIITVDEPLIEFGGFGEVRMDALEIDKSPLKQDPVGLITSRNSDIKVDANGEMVIRGARAGDLAYFIDGVKTNGVQTVPGSAIAGLTVYSSGIPAKYGDTTGGVIVMETKSYFDLYRSWKGKMLRGEISN